MSYNSKHLGQDVDKAVELVLQNSDKWGSGSSTQIDTTLTKSGQAADAKVVGEKISKLSEKISAIPSGKDGITPTIGENGNWYLGDTDTGKPSRGATPQKGTDYWTAADKQEIVNDVLAELPTWEGGNY